ncbi:MAG: peptide chain release factor 1 [Candidatus Omnitrophica bacterium]|nr:peptide chain release factor 1 [Candidatus Omnitrophota bacterium]
MEQRYGELEELLASYDSFSDKNEYNKLAKELASLREPVSVYRELKKIRKELADLQEVIAGKGEDELRELALGERDRLEESRTELSARLEELLCEDDSDADRDVIMEIRAGTGGLEAGLFAADLFRMYSRYADSKGWSVETMSSNETELGSIKEIVFSIKGKNVYKYLRYESGVHRVQRVPQTETQGRIHTSTATVAVLVEPEALDLEIDPNDLRVDTYRSSGPGGQHMQKTDSAVRITHVPTGVVVACQDERSQTKNKFKAMRVLRARLLDARRQEETKRISADRRSQVGTGERSEKIRTYNYPDRRVTDHRINFTTHRLEAILEGDLDEVSGALIKAAREKKEGE